MLLRIASEKRFSGLEVAGVIVGRAVPTPRRPGAIARLRSNGLLVGCLFGQRRVAVERLATCLRIVVQGVGPIEFQLQGQWTGRRAGHVVQQPAGRLRFLVGQVAARQPMRGVERLVAAGLTGFVERRDGIGKLAGQVVALAGLEPGFHAPLRIRKLLRHRIKDGGGRGVLLHFVQACRLAHRGIIGQLETGPRGDGRKLPLGSRGLSLRQQRVGLANLDLGRACFAESFSGTRQSCCGSRSGLA